MLTRTGCAVVDERSIPVTAVVAIAGVGRAVRAVAVTVVIVVGLLVALAQVSAEIASAVVVEVARPYDYSTSLVVVMSHIAVVVESRAEVRAAVSSTVALEDAGCIVVEERAIAVDGVDAEVPRRAAGVDGTIEVILSHEADVLACRHDVAQVFVTIVQIAIIEVDGIVVTVNHIVHDIAHAVDEVVVDFVAVVVLHGSEVQLIGHAVGQIPGVVAHLAARHCHCAQANQSEQHCQEQSLFHLSWFFVGSTSFTTLCLYDTRRPRSLMPMINFYNF